MSSRADGDLCDISLTQVRCAGSGSGRVTGSASDDISLHLVRCTDLGPGGHYQLWLAVCKCRRLSSHSQFTVVTVFAEFMLN